MNNVRKVIVDMYTNWCGEENSFSAIICDECNSEFEEICQQQSYENFSSFGGFDQMMEDEFGEPNEDGEYTDEQINEGYTLEGSYYGFNITDYDPDVHGEWDWYDLVYDCTEKK